MSMKISLNGVWECGNKKVRVPGNNTGAEKYILRRRFFLNRRNKKKMYILRLGGVDYKADISINSRYAGSHTGYFQPFELDITKILLRGWNTISISINSGRERKRDWPENKRSIKGVFGHHDIRPGGWHPEYGQDMPTGGIWGNVEIEETDKTGIRSIKITPVLSNGYKKADIYADIETYEKTIRKHFRIYRPKLWWTHDQGRPHLYRITAETKTCRKEVSFGIREIRLDRNKNVYLNGRRIFIRGTNIIPEEFLSAYTIKRIKKDISLAKKAGINAFRVHAHINRAEFYKECDKEGILIWQDFPLQWEYASGPEFIKEAQRQCRDMVHLLYNHPSVCIWCCHNEPIKSIKKLDPALGDTIKRADKTRPVVQSSNFSEHPYPGWFTGNYRHFVSLPGKPLVTEFGAQALPCLKTLKSIFTEKDIWPPNWKKWAYHNFAYEQTFFTAGIKMGKSINEFVKNSQNYQSLLIKYAVEQYRIHKFKEVSGLFHFMLVDPWPCISYSVLDYFRRPKRGYNALKEAYQPVIAVFTPERPVFTAGDNIRGMFYVINDYPYEIKNARLRISAGSIKYPAKKIDIKANSCSVINKSVYPLPLPKNIRSGRYKMILELTDLHRKIISRNTCTFTIKHIPAGLTEYNAVFRWE